MRLVERLALYKEYFNREPNKTYVTSSVGAIVTYLPEHMSKLLKSLIHDIPIYDANIKETLDWELELYTKSLVSLMKKFHFNNVLLVSLRTEMAQNPMYYEYFQKSVTRLKDNKFCIYVESIVDLANPWPGNNTTMKLWLMYTKPIIVLYGLDYYQYQFLETNFDFLNTQVSYHSSGCSTRKYK